MAILSSNQAHASSGGVSILNVRSISLPNYEALLKASVDSSSKQGTIRTVGRADWSGSYGAYGHTPAVLPGDTAQFEAAFSGSNPTAKGFKGNVVYTGFTVNWDREAADMISHTVDFGGNGELTFGTISTAADDAGPQVVVPSYACVAKVATPGGAFSAIPQVRKMSLAVTAGVNVGFPPDSYPWPQRDTGALDIKASIDVYADSSTPLSGLPTPRSTYELQLFVDATTFWLVKYMQMKGYSNITINRETGEWVGATLNFEWSSQILIDGTPTEGTLTTPDETEIWPEA